MTKAIRNLIIGAAMTAAGVFAASTAAIAATQYVQSDMNFRNGPAMTSEIIGSVPAGAQVDVLDSFNGWDMINYNGRTGYIHGGNVGSSYTAPATTAPAATTPASTSPVSTQSYYDTNWTQTAQNMSNYGYGQWKTVYVSSGYLALRYAPSYNSQNEFGQLYTGDMVQIAGDADGSYIYVFSPKYGTYGWVNAGFLG